MMESYSQKFNAEVQICSHMPGKGPCSGDSGGPVLLEKNNFYFAVIFKKFLWILNLIIHDNFFDFDF